MSPLVISMFIGVAVITLMGVVGLVMTKGPSSAEQRLEGMTGKGSRKRDLAASTLLRPQTFDPAQSQSWVKKLPTAQRLARLYDQADVGLTLRNFLMIDLALGVVSAAVGYFLKLPLFLLPVVAGFMGCLLPWFWLVTRKRKRVKAFLALMPDALELVGRALRAGHGLASGLGLVAEEMPAPISHEFGRVYEEQNLGIPIEEALRGLAERVPATDVRFFVTAVVVQRGTGGDLAEVLDKIGRLIRERFQVLGQVQSLTAEGRLSGIVLLAMPPALMAFCYTTNPKYIGLLFSTSLGTKMLAVAAVLQVVGALAIKKIITIKV
ncbi:MAG TPA: type II secretion system F family protein [Isosphaeraceae bacterium]|nr:type II secretion system F family protein [Isosphaeraceae bacterium]